MDRLLRGISFVVAKIVDYYRWTLGTIPICAPAYIRDQIARRDYRVLNVEELRANRKSDKVFILGTGSSINRISDEEWKHFSEFDTFSFSQFCRNRKIPVGFHMIAEILVLEEYIEHFRNNPYYRDTVYVIQGGWPAYMGNAFVASRIIPKGNSVFRFKRTSRGRLAETPSESFETGIVHNANSVTDMINLAFLIGWKEIVLVGIDLTDKRYFFLGENETQKMEAPGVTYSTPFPGGDIVLQVVKKWNPFLKNRGVTLSVYNPHSLLAAELPVYSNKQ